MPEQRIHTGRRMPWVFMCAAVLAASLAYSVEASVTKLPTLVTLSGISGARPGISAARLEALWGFRLKLEGSPAFPECKEAVFRVGGITGAVLFLNGRWRAAWFTRGIQTPAGIRIGSPLSMVRRAYGARLSREAALYVRGLWLYYVRRPRSADWRLRFDVSAGGRVQRIGFGAYPDVTAQEGC